MKTFRTPLILLIVIGIVGAFAYLDERASLNKQAEDDANTRLLSFSKDEISNLQVYENSTLKYELKLDDQFWWIEYPLATRADDQQVKSFLANLESLRIQKKIEAFSKLEDYALENPSMKILLKTREGKEFSLSLGKDAPVGSGFYVMASNQAAISLIDRSYKELLNFDLYKIRSKKLQLANIDQLSAIGFSNVTNRFKLVRTNQVWSETYDPELKIDQIEVQAFLENFAQIHVKQFIDRPSEALKKALALDKINMSNTSYLSFKTKDELKLYYLIRNEEDLLLKLEGEDGLLKIDSKDANILEKSLWDFQQRRILSFDLLEVSEVEINDRRFEKVENTWKLVSQESTKTDYDQIRRFLIDLQEEKAKDFLDADSLVSVLKDQGEYHVSLKFIDGTDFNFSVWQADNSNYYLKSPRDERYLLIDKQLFSELSDFLVTTDLDHSAKDL